MRAAIQCFIFVIVYTITLSYTPTYKNKTFINKKLDIKQDICFYEEDENEIDYMGRN